MGAQVGGGLELIFLDQVPRFQIGTCLGGGLELLLGSFWNADFQTINIENDKYSSF